MRGLAGYLLPGVIVAVIAFRTGGFYPGATAVACLVLLAGLLLRVTAARHPIEGVGGWVVGAGAALCLFAAWTLASALWSGAPGRALVEFDRALLYAAAFVLFGTIRRRRTGVQVMITGLAAAITAVCLAGLSSKLLPGLLPVEEGAVDPTRLSAPITYWNSLGLLAAVGIGLCLHLTSSHHEPRVSRVLAAAAMPALAVTLLLTFSRGAILAVAIAVLAYVVIGHPRALVSGLVATVVPCAYALRAAYDSAALVDTSAPPAMAAMQAAQLRSTIALACGAAAVLRLLLLLLDARLARLALGRRARRLAAGSAVVVAVAAILVTALALDLPGRTAGPSAQGGSSTSEPGAVRERLSKVGDSKRLALWRASIVQWRAEPLIGRGAGTFSDAWAQRRRIDFEAKDGHSLYLEVLGELGLVGGALLLGAIGAILAGLLWRCRGPQRPVYAAAFSVTLAWAVLAGVDWHWEVPAVTLWVFPLAGAALAVDREGSSPASPGRLGRILAGLGVLGIALNPALLGLSQVRLERAAEAFRGGDCVTTIDASLASIDAVSARPEPFELIALCDARFGYRDLAVRAMDDAVARDPRSWDVRYELAVVRGSVGLDPRLAAFEALRLNPRSALARNAVRAFSTDDPRLWRRRARSARLPLAS